MYLCMCVGRQGISSFLPACLCPPLNIVCFVFSTNQILLLLSSSSCLPHIHSSSCCCWCSFVHGTVKIGKIKPMACRGRLHAWLAFSSCFHHHHPQFLIQFFLLRWKKERMGWEIVWGVRSISKATHGPLSDANQSTCFSYCSPSTAGVSH